MSDLNPYTSSFTTANLILGGTDSIGTDWCAAVAQNLGFLHSIPKFMWAGNWTVNAQSSSKSIFKNVLMPEGTHLVYWSLFNGWGTTGGAYTSTLKIDGSSLISALGAGLGSHGSVAVVFGTRGFYEVEMSFAISSNPDMALSWWLAYSNGSVGVI